MDPSSRRPDPQPTILVTGGAGFVGAEVTRTLLASGARVIVVDDLSGGDRGRLEDHRCLEFHVADENAWDVGLACGGRVRIYLERVE